MSRKLLIIIMLSLAVTACGNGNPEPKVAAIAKHNPSGTGHEMDGWSNKGKRIVRKDIGKLH